MGGRTTISSSETRIEALKLQSSAQGVTIPVVYGVNQISGNLIWYGDFKAVPHTTSQSAGKGGGGVTSESTTYTYSASVMMGLCHGQVNGVPRIWRGKKLYNGGNGTTALLPIVDFLDVPNPTGFTVYLLNPQTGQKVRCVGARLWT